MIEGNPPTSNNELREGQTNFVQVGSLSDISSQSSFLGGEKALIIDLDGVLCLRGENNNVISNVLRLRNLLKVVGEADRVLFSTSRFDLNDDGFITKHIAKVVDFISDSAGLAVSYCPFLTKNSKNFLRDLIQRVNPTCSVNFDATPRKMFNSNENTLNFGKKALDDGLNLTIIGSGWFDRRVATKICKNNQTSSERVNFYSLGLGLI